MKLGIENHLDFSKFHLIGPIARILGKTAYYKAVFREGKYSRDIASAFSSVTTTWQIL